MLKNIVYYGSLSAIIVVILLFIIGTVHISRMEKTAEAVFKINATKLSLDDVLGKNLPLDPGLESDKTLKGIDANQNNIRDDVELAIFKEYSTSTKIRAALLQYALALQMEFTQEIVQTDTVTAVGKQKSRAYDCIGSVVPPSENDLKKITDYVEWVKEKQINTEKRKDAEMYFYKHIGSYSLQSGCDVTLSSLSN